MPILVRLVPHLDFPPRAVEAIEVSADIRRGASVLRYEVSGGPLRIPASAAPERTDELWKHTCFELFVQPEGGEGYFEFNFSPSTRWAAYRFDGYRAGMANQPLVGPIIEPVEAGVRVQVDLADLPEGAWRLAITAVIEEADGTKSYWSAAHPGGNPDFHAAENFVVAP